MLVSILLSLIFAALYAPVVLVDRWIDAPIVEGKAAPVTVRVPPFSGYQDPNLALRGGGVLIARGELVDADHASAAAAVRAATPHGPAPFYAYVAIALALTLLYTLHLGRTNRGRLVRVQVVHLAVGQRPRQVDIADLGADIGRQGRGGDCLEPHRKALPRNR